MTATQWTLLTRLLEEGVNAETLPANLESVIVERLDEALAAPGRAELDSLKAALADFFTSLVQRAPSDAAQAVRGDSKASGAATAAFRLGQIAFAQHLAAQTAERRADDRFVQIIEDPSYSAYWPALMSGERTGQELAARVDERPETVSRKLKVLRELGVTDTHRQGVSIYNFLTPAARAALESSAVAEAPQRESSKVRLVRQRHNATSAAFQDLVVLPPPLLGH